MKSVVLVVIATVSAIAVATPSTAKRRDHGVHAPWQAHGGMGALKGHHYHKGGGSLPTVTPTPVPAPVPAPVPVFTPAPAPLPAPSVPMVK
jgi:hypothetical protein